MVKLITTVICMFWHIIEHAPRSSHFDIAYAHPQRTKIQIIDNIHVHAMYGSSNLQLGFHAGGGGAHSDRDRLRMCHTQMDK